MHSMHIVDIITKIATQNPAHRQELIDLATLGYRDGLISEKLTRIADDEDMDINDLTEADLLPHEVDDVVKETESWFRELMMLNAKAMVASHSEDQQIAGKEYIKQMETVRKNKRNTPLQVSGVDLTEFMKNFKPIPARMGNRMKIAMDELSKEHPGLFD